MFCWQARARFGDRLERDEGSSPVARGGSPLDMHLASCGACRAELEGLGAVRSRLADAGRSPLPSAGRMDDAWFEQTVLRRARARMAEDTSRALPQGLPSFARPIPLGAALSLMITAVALAHFVVGTGTSRPVTQPEPVLASRDLDDSVAPPREVPFSVQQDLVGTRRGSIPLTTYVLEPAPNEKPILRASL